MLICSSDSLSAPGAGDDWDVALADDRAEDDLMPVLGASAGNGIFDGHCLVDNDDAVAGTAFVVRVEGVLESDEHALVDIAEVDVIWLDATLVVGLGCHFLFAERVRTTHKSRLTKV